MLYITLSLPSWLLKVIVNISWLSRSVTLGMAYQSYIHPRSLFQTRMFLNIHIPFTVNLLFSRWNCILTFQILNYANFSQKYLAWPAPTYINKSSKSQFELVSQMLLSKEGFPVGSQMKLRYKEGSPGPLVHLHITLLQSPLKFVSDLFYPLVIWLVIFWVTRVFKKILCLSPVFIFYPFFLSSSKKKIFYLLQHCCYSKCFRHLSFSDKIALVPLAFYPQSHFNNYLYLRTPKIIFYVIFKFITLVNSSIG